MAYELHLERESGFLCYDDWLKAIEAVDGVRLYSKERYDNDPDLEQPFPFHPPEGTAEMQFDNDWIPVFYWQGGSVVFKLGDEAEKVLAAALAMAERMNADVRGDEGELYKSLEDLIPPEFR